MKKLLFLTALCAFSGANAQEHYAGINTSQRGGLLNAGINPAELMNFEGRYDVHVFSISAKGANQHIGFRELFTEDDFANRLFAKGELVNLRADGQITGPGIAYRMEKWAFGLSTRAYARMDMVDINPYLGDALTRNITDSFFSGVSFVNNTGNQKLTATSWGEVALTGATVLFEYGTHKLNIGGAFKILFPGSYARFGANSFQGKITNELGNINLTETTANLNIAYSGNLADDFSNFSDYTQSLFGKPGGVGADIGVNYRIKDDDGSAYKLNFGASLRNIGSMKFKSSNNSETDYALSIQGTDSLNLNQFQNAKSLRDVETILLATGFLNRSLNERKTFKVALPTLFHLYADVKIVPKFFVTAFTQLKVNKDQDNGQVAEQNTFSLTPRYNWSNIEVYLPLSSSEFSGFATGIGFRAYGFFIGSGSVITALASNAKQADAYFGYSFQLD